MRVWLAVLAATGLILGSTAAGAVAGAAPPRSVPRQAQELRVPVKAEPDGRAVSLDVSVFSPSDGARHPAVLLAHGFGGSKSDLAAQGADLAGRGYVALTYTARGFGASGGRIHLDAPEYEVDDARRLLDTLASRSDVQMDGPGDPRVGVVGGSYGGALALMAAGTDPRVDAVAASITWNDLSAAFFPQSAAGVDRPGPFAALWASTFFSGVIAQGPPPGTPAAGSSPSGRLCGRFDATLCAAFLPVANSGRPSQGLRTILRRNSPVQTNAKITAPTLLVQGQSDSLFGLGQADATWRQLTNAGTAVAMRWTDGGHDSPSLTADADVAAVHAWLERYLTDAGRSRTGLPVPAFVYAGVAPRGSQTPPLHSAPSYPGLSGTASADVGFASSAPQHVLSPPGARPAAILAVPGLGNVINGAASYRLAALPGASAAFDTVPLPSSRQVVGSPKVRFRLTSTAADATLYASLWQVSGGSATLVHRLSAPLQVRTTPGEPTDVTLALPPGVWSMPAGSSWRVLLTSTDSASAAPLDARLYTVQPLGAVQLPTVAGVQSGQGRQDTDRESWIVATAVGVVLLGIVASLIRGRRRARVDARQAATARAGGTDDPDVVLAVEHLVKTYRDGHRAVDDVSFEARRGQVVGLLGPNGAGKTTTLRMVMGLIRPTSGQVRVLGRVVRPGSAVLADVGALVEGPGFLPHLSGRANLEAYWSATGRPIEQAHLEETLEVAALGDAIDRPVRSYSQGMRQRIGIAQAMLGLPDVLILDEPTNGLDPPQIAGMRPVLQAYAATGRTVLVSSHLLAEVEMTCTHVVVMDRGHVIVTGSVDELTTAADGHTRRRLEEVFLGALSDSHGDSGTGGGQAMDTEAVVERLRQVRSR